jgi:hypothetical protein
VQGVGSGPQRLQLLDARLVRQRLAVQRAFLNVLSAVSAFETAGSFRVGRISGSS